MSENTKSFLGLTTTGEVEKAIYKIQKEAVNEFAEQLQSYHLNEKKKQAKLERDFKYASLDKIPFNIWDDFYDDGFAPEGEVTKTFAYIASRDFPDKECFKILLFISEYIKDNSLLPEGIEIYIDYYDSTHKYPKLVQEYKYSLYKRWQLNFTNISHRALDDLVLKLKNLPPFSNTPFDVYSES
jgi:hypothetical protein